MRSRLTKVAHTILGQPLLSYPVRALIGAGASEIVVVLPAAHPELERLLSGFPVRFAYQNQPRGTGDALRAAVSSLPANPGTLLITYGDSPLLQWQTLAQLAELSESSGGLALLSTELADPKGYGRVMRDQQGQVTEIVEEKDLPPGDNPHEINAGVYATGAEILDLLPELEPNNNSSEFYLTDIVALYRKRGWTVQALSSPDASQAWGVNNRLGLARAESILLDQLRNYWMEQGVRMVAPETIYLEATVKLAPDVTLWPGVILRGQTEIAAGASVGAYSVLDSVILGENVELKSHVVAERVELKSGADAGPFARLRPGTILESGVHVGNFVEVKNSHLGNGVQAGHLAYIGDAEIGPQVNIGAGAITANYDGRRKNQTKVGAGAFIGSNAVLVAPLEVGAGAWVAAGSTITQDVPDQALAIARERQRNIEGYRKKDSSD